MEVEGPADGVLPQEPGFAVPNALNLDFFDLLPSLPLPQLPGLSCSEISDLCNAEAVLGTSHEDIRVIGTLLCRTDSSYLNLVPKSGCKKAPAESDVVACHLISTLNDTFPDAFLVSGSCQGDLKFSENPARSGSQQLHQKPLNISSSAEIPKQNIVQSAGVSSPADKEAKNGHILSPQVIKKKRTSVHIAKRLPSQAEQLENDVQELRRIVEVAVREHSTCDMNPAPASNILLLWHQIVRKAASQRILTSIPHDLLQAFVRMLDAVVTEASHCSKAEGDFDNTEASAVSSLLCALEASHLLLTIFSHPGIQQQIIVEEILERILDFVSATLSESAYQASCSDSKKKGYRKANHQGRSAALDMSVAQDKLCALLPTLSSLLAVVRLQDSLLLPLCRAALNSLLLASATLLHLKVIDLLATVCEFYPQHRTFLADELALIFLKQQQQQQQQGGGAASSRRKHASLRAYSLMDSDHGNDYISMVAALLMHLMQAAAFVPAMPEPATLQQDNELTINASGIRKKVNKPEAAGKTPAEGKGKRSSRSQGRSRKSVSAKEENGDAENMEIGAEEGRKPEQKTVQSASKGGDGQESAAVRQSGLDPAISLGMHWWRQVLGQLSQSRTGGVADGADMRVAVETLVEDLLVAVHLPEFPAAALLLQLLSVVLDTPLGLRSEAAAVRGTAVDLLGLLATRLRSDTASLPSTPTIVRSLLGSGTQQPVHECQAAGQDRSPATSPPPSLVVARSTASSVNAPGASSNAVVPAQPSDGGSGCLSPGAVQQGQTVFGSESCVVCVALARDQSSTAGRRGSRLHQTLKSNTVRCGTCRCYFHLECMGLQAAVASSYITGKQCLPCEARKRLQQTMNVGVKVEGEGEEEREEGGAAMDEEDMKRGLQPGGGEENIDGTSELVVSQLLLDYLVAGAAASLGLASVKRCCSFYMAMWLSHDLPSAGSLALCHQRLALLSLRAPTPSKLLSSTPQSAPSALHQSSNSSLTPPSASIPRPVAQLLSHHLNLRRPFARSFDALLARLLACLMDKPTIRAKAMKALSSLVEADPSILSLDIVRKAVEDRFLDASVSVREAAIDLVGKHVLTSPQVALKYYHIIAERVRDTGLSVRTRVIRILRDLCLHSSSSPSSFPPSSPSCLLPHPPPPFPFAAHALSCIFSRASDEEQSVRDLVLRCCREIWFEAPLPSISTSLPPPLFSLPSSSAAQSPLSPPLLPSPSTRGAPSVLVLAPIRSGSTLSAVSTSSLPPDMAAVRDIAEQVVAVIRSHSEQQQQGQGQGGGMTGVQGGGGGVQLPLCHLIRSSLEEPLPDSKPGKKQAKEGREQQAEAVHGAGNGNISGAGALSPVVRSTSVSLRQQQAAVRPQRQAVRQRCELICRYLLECVVQAHEDPESIDPVPYVLALQAFSDVDPSLCMLPLDPARFITTLLPYVTAHAHERSGAGSAVESDSSGRLCEGVVRIITGIVPLLRRPLPSSLFDLQFHLAKLVVGSASMSLVHAGLHCLCVLQDASSLPLKPLLQLLRTFHRTMTNEKEARFHARATFAIGLLLRYGMHHLDSLPDSPITSQQALSRLKSLACSPNLDVRIRALQGLGNAVLACPQELVAEDTTALLRLALSQSAHPWLRVQGLRCLLDYLEDAENKVVERRRSLTAEAVTGNPSSVTTSNTSSAALLAAPPSALPAPSSSSSLTPGMGHILHPSPEGKAESRGLSVNDTVESAHGSGEEAAATAVVPVAAGAGDSCTSVRVGVSSGAVQLHWPEVLRCAVAREGDVRHAALKLIQRVLHQGLVLPVTCVPHLIALQLDPLQANWKLAHRLLQLIEDRWSSYHFVENRFSEGLRLAHSLLPTILPPPPTLNAPAPPTSMAGASGPPASSHVQPAVEGMPHSAQQPPQKLAAPGTPDKGDKKLSPGKKSDGRPEQGSARKRKKAGSTTAGGVLAAGTESGMGEGEREREMERALADWLAAAVIAVKEGAGRVYQLVRGQKGQRNAVLLSMVRLFDPQAMGGGTFHAPFSSSSSSAAAVVVEGGAGAAQRASAATSGNNSWCIDFPTFCAHAISGLPYSLVEEPLFLIHHLSRIAQLRAPAVMAALSSLLRGHATSASPGKVKKMAVVVPVELENGGKHQPAGGNIAGSVAGDNSDDVVEVTADSGDGEEGREGATIIGSDALAACNAGMTACMAIRLKAWLQSAFSLSESRCQMYNPADSAQRTNDAATMNEAVPLMLPAYRVDCLPSLRQLLVIHNDLRRLLETDMTGHTEVINTVSGASDDGDVVEVPLVLQGTTTSQVHKKNRGGGRKEDDDYKPLRNQAKDKKPRLRRLSL